MSGIIFHSRVEDILKAILSHEDEGENSDAFENGVFWSFMTPDQFEIIYGVHFSFVFFYFKNEVGRS